MYQEREKAISSEVLDLQDKYGYEVRIKPPEVSQENSLDEIPHGYIGESLRGLIEMHDNIEDQTTQIYSLNQGPCHGTKLVLIYTS